MLDQPLGEALQPGEAHEGDERARDAGERGGVEPLDVVRRERGDCGRETAMRDRDAGRGGDGRERRHTRDDLE